MRARPGLSTLSKPALRCRKREDTFRGGLGWVFTSFMRGSVTGLFLANENTVGPAIDLLALVLREASRDRRQEVIVEGQIELRDSGIAVQPSVFLD